MEIMSEELYYKINIISRNFLLNKKQTKKTPENCNKINFSNYARQTCIFNFYRGEKFQVKQTKF